MRVDVKSGTVALVDVVGYSRKASVIEQSLGAKALSDLNVAIQKLINEGLSAANLKRSDHIVMTTGDGALLYFEKVDSAIDFSIKTIDASKSYNRLRSESLAQLSYRIGVGTGDIAVDGDAQFGNGLAGMAIIRAARLEASANPQGILIDLDTWHGASPASVAAFTGPEHIAGKHGEVFEAYRLLDPDVEFVASPIEKSPQLDRRALAKSALSKIDLLTRAVQISRLEIRLQIPLMARPSDTLDIERRALEIFRWAEAEGLMELLNEELSSIVGV